MKLKKNTKNGLSLIGLLEIAKDFSHNNPPTHVHDFELGIRHLSKVKILQNFHYEIYTTWVLVVVKSFPLPSPFLEENLLQKHPRLKAFFV